MTMLGWGKIAIIAALLAGAGTIALQRSHNLQLQAEKATVTLARDHAQGQVKTQQAIIGTMAEGYMTNLQAHTTLRTQVAQANSLLRRHEQLIKQLERDNEQLKTWSNTALPGPVIRLRQRPTITGSQAYRDWLSERDAVSATPDPAAYEWRPAARP